MKKIFLSIFTLSIICLSCSKEENQLETNTDTSNFIVKSGSDLQTEADIYAKLYIANHMKLIDAMKINNKVVFSADIHNKLASCKDDQEMKAILDFEGVTNSGAIVDLLKAGATIQNDFISSNPEFTSMSSKEQEAILNPSLNGAMDEFPVIYNPGYYDNVPYSCVRDYNRDISRCNRDYAICGGFAVGSAAFGIWPGLVAGAACMISHHYCTGDAAEDYQDCLDDAA